MKLQEIADTLEIPLKRVKEIDLRAIRKLRHPYRIKLLKEFTDETIDGSLLQRFSDSRIL